MLTDFLKDHRSELIQRCRDKVSTRRAPRATPAELEFGVPLFLDQLTGMLASAAMGAQQIAPKPGSRAAAAEENLQSGARKHGEELLRHDFTIEQVVHDYGDLCQSITELANEKRSPITVQEFGTLNIKLDNAIASAVTGFSRHRDERRADESALATTERLGVLAHEMRNLLNTSILAIAAMKSGSVGFGGATAAALDRSLIGMRSLIDRTLAEVRLESGGGPRHARRSKWLRSSPTCGWLRRWRRRRRGASSRFFRSSPTISWWPTGTSSPRRSRTSFRTRSNSRARRDMSS